MRRVALFDRSSVTKLRPYVRPKAYFCQLSPSMRAAQYKCFREAMRFAFGQLPPIDLNGVLALSEARA